MSVTDKYVYIGRIVSPHGIRGEVKVKRMTDNPERFAKDNYVYLIKDEEVSSRRIVNLKPLGDFVVLKLEEVTDINDAEKLRNYYVGIGKDQLEKLEEGNYYHFEIMGLPVYSVEGEFLGDITDIFSTGGNDVYVVKGHGKEIYIPALKSVVESIDIKNKRVTVRRQPGLF